ncbi:TPA: hypothetical protein ACH3X1_014280 [Trebouxia sp. C0004]
MTCENVSHSPRESDTRYSPREKSYKDTSGDVRTAATVTAAVPTDATGTTPAAQSLVQLTQSQLKAAEAAFGKKFEEQTQSSIARENAVKDSCQHSQTQQLSAIQLCWSVWSRPGLTVWGPTGSHHQSLNLSQLSHALAGQVQATRQCWWSIPRAKHRTYALSIQLRQQGISLTDELTPKQQQAQKALDPDRIVLRSKGFRTWFRHGTLGYLDQGVPRECKQGEAVRLPQPQGSPPKPNMPAARAPPRGPSSHLKQAPGRSRVSIPTGAPRANRVVAPIPASCQPPPRPASPPSPSNAFVAGSDPVTAMDTGSAAPVGPGAGPSSALHLILLAPLQLPLQSAQFLH